MFHTFLYKFNFLIKEIDISQFCYIINEIS